MGSLDEPNAVPNATRETDILVVGGGPVGMVAAYQLAQCGQPCMLVEQSLSTTRWPKMEFTNSRAMELYRKMGLAEALRKEAIPPYHHFNEIITTGYGDTGDTVTVWERESPDALRKKWKRSNNGSHPLEPYMRLSQIVFEAWLKPLVLENPLIDSLWGHTFTGMVEKADAVYSTLIDSSGHETVIKSKYVIGCDGAGSAVRTKAGLESKRTSIPIDMMLVHFKSRDVSRLQSRGRFWHTMCLNGTAIVAQDEADTWTVHQMVPPGTDPDAIDPLNFIYANLGGLGDPYPVKVDEVLMKSKWRFDLATADSFRSAKGRVFLAGDAAHQLTPAGGHGLNSGIADVFDLGWKLAAVLKGYGGGYLLDSYNYERRTVALNNSKIVEKSTMEILMPMFTLAQKYGREALIAKNEDGRKLRAELKGWIDQNYWIHDQQGTDMGYRFNGSPIVLPDYTGVEPPQSVRSYAASTWPGGRAPHVFLADGMTSIFDLYGPGFTIVDFSSHGEISDRFVAVAKGWGIPLKKVHIPDEKHAREIWERDVVLLRPEGHVAWRAAGDGSSPLDKDAIEDILLVAIGKKVSPGHVPAQ